MIAPTVSDDTAWMRIALEEAAKGRGRVEPNPMVGCVVVRDGHLIASGYHHFFGGPHAEVDALQNVDCENATIYVTLEPCSHFGKTPPCAPFVVSRKPARVVVAMEDPNPQVAGRGIALLRAHGLDVCTGILEAEARELNAPYLKRLRTGLPWTIAKWAMTLDGAIATATGESKWISNEQSRAEVHRMRSGLDAIVVGIQTAIRDDPLLTSRLANDEKPLRIAKRVVLDHDGRLPLNSQLVQTARVAPLWVIVGEQCMPMRRDALLQAGATVHTIPKTGEYDSLTFALKALSSEGATQVLIEGGGTVLGSAFDLGLIDQIECFIAPKIFGGDAKRPVFGKGILHAHDATPWQHRASRMHGDDIQLSFRTVTKY